MNVVSRASLTEGLKGNQTGDYLRGLLEAAAEGTHVENYNVMWCEGECVGYEAVSPEA